MPVELGLEERRKSVDVAQYDDDIVKEEAYKAGYYGDRVPKGGLKEQLVNDDVDDKSKGECGSEEVVIRMAVQVVCTFNAL